MVDDLSLDITRLRLESAKTRVLDYIDDHLEEWVMEEVVQPTQSIAWGEGLSEHAISLIDIEREDYLKIKLVWNLYGEGGEPLGIWLERGTKEHEIRALGKLFGGAESLMWYSKGGKPIFRKKVKHPGTKGKFILKRGWEIGKKNLSKRIAREVNNWLQVDKIG